jgi:protein-L-isoaspartate(D-aspartate) O-methyltransferase
MIEKVVMQTLINNLKNLGVLKTPALIKAFKLVDRSKFVPESYQEQAYVDAPLPIGFEQTISQPYTVAFMLELLQPKPGQKILDIGSGSGWTSGLLASVVGRRGHVWGLEILPTLFEVGKRNLAEFNFSNLTLLNRSGWSGYEKAAPYDGILVSAAADQLPPKLLSQLKPGGRLVIPLANNSGQEICLFVKSLNGGIIKKCFPGFVFVPLIKT